MKIIEVAGGLGSQMMAYSLGLILKKKYTDKVACDFSWYDYYPEHNGPELEKLFGINEYKVNKLFSFTIHSRSFISKIIKKILVITHLLKFYEAQYNKYNYDSNVFSQSGNVVYKQCWTSYKYFVEVEPEIRQVFVFPEIFDIQNKEIFSLIKNSNSVSIHVRRGDYKSNATLKDLAPINYYASAISYIQKAVKDPVFFVFSDDIEWCINNFQLPEVNYIGWNKGATSFRDMQLMAACKHNIIPNSSFSWWGAWLNENPEKIVITPAKWVNASSGQEMKDMNMPNWITLKNFE